MFQVEMTIWKFEEACWNDNLKKHGFASFYILLPTALWDVFTMTRSCALHSEYSHSRASARGVNIDLQHGGPVKDLFWNIMYNDLVRNN